LCSATGRDTCRGACTEAIAVTRAEYERIRTCATRFVVALDHENPETETIIKQNERFAVVETYAGEASEIARETDPRANQRTRQGVQARDGVKGRLTAKDKARRPS
jgi:hypothetical protein